ncbi:MAG: glutathione S-transferase family protein [Acetobacteraceae bacterium]
MQLYYSPGACSLGIHVLLEEIDKPYDKTAISLQGLDQYKPDYIKVNAKSKVPTLVRDDGSILTEFPAIAFWLAQSNPGAGLLPTDTESQTRVLEALDYVVATIHMQGFSRLFRAANFTPAAADEEKVKARGREIAEKGFALINQALAGKEYIIGRFSIADAALFYVEFCAAGAMKIPLPANCAAHFARMKTRPAVARALSQEGLTA